MTDVIDLFTKKKVDRRKTRSNQIRDKLFAGAELAHRDGYKSFYIVMIDENGESITDYVIEPEHMAIMALELYDCADEVRDIARGVEDLDYEE